MEQQANSIKTKEDFIHFVKLLAQKFNEEPEKWENKTVDSYLEALANWTEDMDGYYQNIQMPIPENINWKVFADMLIAASMYE